MKEWDEGGGWRRGIKEGGEEYGEDMKREGGMEGLGRRGERGWVRVEG